MNGNLSIYSVIDHPHTWNKNKIYSRILGQTFMGLNGRRSPLYILEIFVF